MYTTEATRYTTRPPNSLTGLRSQTSCITKSLELATYCTTSQLGGTSIYYVLCSIGSQFPTLLYIIISNETTHKTSKPFVELHQ
jgi:hypothetical protein